MNCALFIPVSRAARWIVYSACIVMLAYSCRTVTSKISPDREVDKSLMPAGAQVIFCNDWVTFIKAIEKASAGQVIQLKNGRYEGNITIRQSGLPGKPVTIVPESRGGVIITGNSSWDIDASHVTVDGFYFLRGTSTQPVNFSFTSTDCKLLNTAIIAWNLDGKDTRLIGLRGARHEVAYCFLSQKNTPGMMLEVVRNGPARNDHRIHHMYFGYFKDAKGKNGYETVRISTSGYSLSSSHTILEHSLFERCDGEAEIISSKSGHNTFRGNTFLNSDGALTLRHGHDCLVEKNYFLNTLDRNTNRCNGVRVIGERHVVRNNFFSRLPAGAQALQVEYGNIIPHPLTHYDQVKEALIEKNTISFCAKGLSIGVGRDEQATPPRILPPSGMVKNNLISVLPNGLPLQVADEVLKQNLFTFEHNIILAENPSTENLPASGIQFIYGSAASVRIPSGTGAQDMQPLKVSDVVPAWMQRRIAARDPDFTAIPW